ncbi:NO-inducible flavohemoprotein [Psychrobium sp. 1_MG-2023]|uniref:NO-inducible flavohemoprotein n=1 Tax=Psychrobium sp. 1_MG-2023 TaxID=3062624 RepID=UPI000C32AC14|nr:NO-inducible flavohemoprotein [Psychrobium sp. 1_MG-2023]MDP2561642.1 NO-inducible flavohemoprotein [Psychrobium sp. 1_MG-2023]PKF55659.1 NO-inducible flavohemoprotein [Alteromonadales bacterium alter-6D02]
MISTQEIKLVQSTIPQLEEGGSAVTDHFYRRMFSHNTELKDIFNMSNQHTGRQKVALFEAIIAYVKNLNNLSVLKPAVERIAHKHTSFNIEPEHYDIVGHHLIETLRELIPDLFSPQVEAAWLKAYGLLASLFIDRESELYKERAQLKGGWHGKRAFTVIRKVKESELVTSFIFEPNDCQPVMTFEPGQYISIELTPDTSENIEIRQYSLSTAPNGASYRISVKREQGQFDGIVSNYIHDNLEVGDSVDLRPPTGDFFFQDKQSPVVLISAGVGVTPMQAMLETLAAKKYQQPLTYIHACENSAQHSFNQRTAELCEINHWQHHTWYNGKGVPNSEHIHQGLIDFNAIELPLTDGDFYLCGPVGFMQFANNTLQELGVNPERIHYEVFGPHATLS